MDPQITQITQIGNVQNLCNLRNLSMISDFARSLILRQQLLTATIARATIRRMPALVDAGEHRCTAFYSL